MGHREWKTDADDERWDRIYSDYQKKYRDNPRESDKKSARYVLSAGLCMNAETPRVLDIGCSTCNFLRHLRHVMPDAQPFGGNLMKGHLEECRQDPTLAGITFEEIN